MEIHRLNRQDLIRTLIVGLVVAIGTAAAMLILLRAGLSPLPKPLGLAFAQRLLGEVPLPVGLLFHTVWVIAFSGVYVALFRDDLTFRRALWLAAGLWMLVLILFFPVVGWGFLGLAVSPRLIVAAAVAHLLFAVLLWGGCRIAFRDTAATSAASR